jgi:hypothetical protein
MDKTIQNTGDLRALLTESLKGAIDGTLSHDAARNVAKLAAQINDSFRVEVSIARARLEMRDITAFPAIGTLAIK